MHRLDLGLYSRPKEFQANGVRTILTPREKIPSTGKKLSTEEDRTHDAASSRTASPTHYQLSYSGPTWGQQVPALTVYRQALVKVATRVSTFELFMSCSTPHHRLCGLEVKGQHGSPCFMSYTTSYHRLCGCEVKGQHGSPCFMSCTTPYHRLCGLEVKDKSWLTVLCFNTF